MSSNSNRSRNNRSSRQNSRKNSSRTSKAYSNDPVILYLWSRQSRYSEEVLDYLFQSGLASDSTNAIVHSICCDNRLYRNMILKNKNGIKATTIPCFVVTIEKNGEKSTTIIDRPEDMKDFTSSLIEKQQNQE